MAAEGEPCEANADCEVGLFCDAAACEGPGACATVPDLADCIGPPPVCGCSGDIYPNACYAHFLGERVAGEFPQCAAPPPGP